jgi:lipoprotein-releasing system ATP-binding protein
VTEVVRAAGVCKGFGPADARIQVLADVELAVAAGELVAVAGSSGSGKSTLLHILGGLLHPDAGQVEVDGDAVYGISEFRRAALRNTRVGFVFQFHHLLPEFTAAENVALPALVSGTGHAAALERARELLALMGLADRASHKPGEMSGGEQQRVAVARALVNHPRVILADEPSGNLDTKASEQLHAQLEDLARQRGVALVIATHSPALARRAHRTLVLKDHRLHVAGDLEGWA